MTRYTPTATTRAIILMAVMACAGIVGFQSQRTLHSGAAPATKGTTSEQYSPDTSLEREPTYDAPEAEAQRKPDAGREPTASPRIWTGPIGADRDTAIAAQRKAGATDLYFPVSDGSNPTADCEGVFEGITLFSGDCELNTEGAGTSVFSPRDGCTFDVFQENGRVVGTLSAYRNACAPVDKRGDTIALGPLRRDGHCWIGASARICAE